MKNYRVALISSLFVLPLAAQAGVILTAGNNSIANSQNVLFNGSGAISGPALLVSGLTNTTNDVIDFFGAGKNLVTPSSGQARIEAESGTYSALTIDPHVSGVSLYGVVFNLNADADGNLAVTVNANDGTYVFSTNAISGNGQNFFTIEAVGSTSIDSVDLATSVGIEDLRQIRLGTTAPVPEPGTMALLSLGVAAFARKRSKN